MKKFISIMLAGIIALSILVFLTAALIYGLSGFATITLFVLQFLNDSDKLLMSYDDIVLALFMVGLSIWVVSIAVLLIYIAGRKTLEM